MLRSQRTRGFVCAIGRHAPIGVLLALATAAGGCSADLNRFDFPTSAGYNGAGAPVPSQPMRRNAGIPVEQTGDYATGPATAYDAPRGGYGAPPAYGNASRDSGPAPYDYASRAPVAPRGGYDAEPAYGAAQGAPRTYDSMTTRGTAETRMAALPPSTPADSGARGAASGGYDAQRPAYVPPNRQPQAEAPARKAAAPANLQAKSGDSIEVQPGETLTSISKRYRVSVSELMALNNLRSPSLRPGQTLVLPRGRRVLAAQPAAQPQPWQRESAPAAPIAAHGGHDVAAPIATAQTDGEPTHVVKQGESLYGIARKYNVKLADLQSANGIADVTKIKPGVALTIPGDAARSAAPTRLASAESADRMADAGGPAGASIRAVTPTVKPRIINSEAGASNAQSQRVAAVNPDTPAASDARGKSATATVNAAPVGGLADPPKLAAAGGKFRWPVKGKVIAGFGQRRDKSHNDGINISVPQGTEVMAAENGVVAYAGNELKGYGNLVLVRHEGNWVSAYAHNDELLVHRGDKVKRGQPIAKAGNTGSVDQPQVHFELRQGSTAVDPMPHMERQ